MIFRKYFLLIILFIFCAGVKAQEQNEVSYVNYKMKLSSPTNKAKNDTLKNNDLNKKAKEVMQSIYDIECELYFTKTRSLFRVKHNLRLEEDYNYKIVKRAAGGIKIKDLENKTKIEHKQSYGEHLNIEYPFDEFDWIITKEKKIIGKYICYKAKTYKLDYNPIDKGFRRFNITAWFTPEIPIPFGPKGMDGLPGLVLEASSGRIVFFATHIKLNSLNNPELLEAPKGGINITEEQLIEVIKSRYN